MSSAPHPNSVWLEFLQAWSDEARSKGTKVASAYQKAYRSLAAETEAFSHPCETVKLTGIGDSIAKRLEASYANWCKENSVQIPEKPVSQRTSRPVSCQAEKVTRPRRQRKEYVPEPRTGAHGILVGLYTYVAEAGDHAASCSKAELIARAQPYCDSDYSVPGGGSSRRGPSSLANRTAAGSQFSSQHRRSYITAWSAMKTLIDRAYVYRSGNPPRFYLSEQGLQVAKVLAEAEDIVTSTESDSLNTVHSEHPGMSSAAEFPLEETSQSVATQNAVSSSTDQLSQQAACVAENHDSHASNSEILREKDRLYLPPRKHYLDESRSRTPPTQSNALQSGISRENELNLDMQSTDCFVVDLVQSSQDDCYVVTEPSMGAITEVLSSPRSVHDPICISISLVDSSPVIQETARHNTVIASSPLAHQPIRWQQEDVCGIESSSNPSSPTMQAVGVSPVPAQPQIGCHCLPGNSYTIHMIMDHREVRAKQSGHSDTNRRVTFEEAMQRRGVQCELRALELGDILWVARPKPNLTAAQALPWKNVQEVVLDAVVERKRLDDLTSSLFDGRWHEQKQRLRCSGIGRIFYLIEDVDVANIVQRHGDQIQTALSSTQIIDGFHVQRTAHAEGTADFLARMHGILQEIYCDQPLYVIRDEMIDREHYDTLQAHLRTQQPDTPFHTSFHTYQSLHNKSSAANTLQDTWIRMLSCVRRVSPEKAEEITQRWPTPMIFFRALRNDQQKHGEESARKFVSSMIDDQVLVPRRKIGKALSAQLWSLICSSRYADSLD
ncbi:Crossover junction endonuclease mus81 [Malassezia yamatoensis]|uniref:Crossover junction endonuclease MUS81 n=1 Tax=Malassezia yamatoensis TaxID=253288 RepID=A0AAJ5YXA5_9BASI|nr:Crossover junction endonuclease mus81 [Malassezia yamatoensis]